MAAQKRARTKKYFTAAEANAMLPLLRSILRDVTELARDLRDRHERLARLEATPRASLADAYKEELQQIEALIHFRLYDCPGQPQDGAAAGEFRPGAFFNL